MEASAGKENRKGGGNFCQSIQVQRDGRQVEVDG